MLIRLLKTFCARYTSIGAFFREIYVKKQKIKFEMIKKQKDC